jgi:hypothetical protein
MSKEKILERRVDFLTEFILAMRKQDIEKRFMDRFERQDREWITDTCKVFEVDSEPYLTRYDLNLGYKLWISSTQ